MTEDPVRYRDLLRSADVTLILIATNVGRLSSGLIPFGIVAYFTSNGEYSQAGVASAVFMIVTALSAPMKGRFITRASPRHTLLPMVSLYGALSAAGILLSEQGLPFIVGLVLIGLGGLVAPPTGAVVRSVWTRIAPTAQANRALHALDSVTEEFTFAVAPVITAGIWVWLGAVWAVPAGAVLAALGTLMLLAIGLRQSSSARPVFVDPIPAEKSDEPSHDLRSRLGRAFSAYRTRAAAGMLVPMLGLGAAMGALSIVLPAWSGEHAGGQAFSGVLLGVISFSGGIVGLIAGRLPTTRLSDVRQYQVACALVVISMVAFSMSTSVAVSLAAAVLLGAGMTPMFISSYVLVSMYARPGDHTELNAALGSGFNLGDGLAGAAVGFVIAASSGTTGLATAAVGVAVLCAASLLLPSAAHSRTALSQGVGGEG